MPFDVVFKSPDKTLKERLKAEAGGILAWAIDGCLAWQRWGLSPPKKVVDATNDYLHDQDDIQIFVEERCEDLRGVEGFGQRVRTSSIELYGAWQDWCERNGGYAGPKKDFSQRMAAKFEHVTISNLMHFYDVRLNVPEPPPAFDDRVGAK